MNEIDLKKLETEIKLKWHQTLGIWYIENKFLYPIKLALASNKYTNIFLRKLANLITSRFLEPKNLKDTFSQAYQRLKSNDQFGYENDSSFGYSGDVFFNELSVAHHYKKQIDEGFNGPSESKALYEHIVKVSTDLIDRTDARYYFNFGISYAYTDSLLAKKFPDVNFFGIERTEAAQIYNQIQLGEITNLEIFSGDVFKLLQNRRFDGGIFFHSRTLLLLPEEFIRALYKAAHDAGFKYILATEQYGVSRQTGKAYQFSYEKQESVVYRHFMYIHNWPNILRECGFELNRIEAIKTSHPHEDYRILSFESTAISN